MAAKNNLYWSAEFGSIEIKIAHVTTLPVNLGPLESQPES